MKITNYFLTSLEKEAHAWYYKHNQELVGGECIGLGVKLLLQFC